MSDFIRWLVGLKESPDWVAGGRWHVEFQSLPKGGWAVLSVALVLLTVAAIWWLYRKEGRGLSLPARATLAALRFGLLACVCLMLMELVLVITKTELVRSQLLILVDNSESMSLEDPYTNAGQALKTAQAAGLVDKGGKPQVDQLRKARRFELAARAVDGMLRPLADGRQVSLYTFSNRLEPLPKGTDLKDIKPRGVETAIGEALKGALAAHRGQPIAGVLVVSDGQSNAGGDPRKISQQAGKEGIPIHGLAVGTLEGPSNARLVEIDSNPVVFVRDPTEIGVLVEARGLSGRTASITLEQRPDGGEWTEIGREELVLGEDAAVRRATFRITPENTGQFDLRARVADVGVELTEADNVATCALKVVRQRIRVLAIAGYPSPEVQFIRNALLRDVALEFASWLQTATEGYEHIGHRPIRRLPASRKDLEHYDVIILFDPDMKALGPEWPDMLARFVGEAGGGLVYIAGELHTQPLFAGGATGESETGPIDNSWLKILPVASDPGLVQSTADVRLSSRETWTLELSPEGTSDSIFRFNNDPAANKEIISSLPGMYWHFPVSRAKPGAAVLARHGDPRMRNANGRHVLLATQRYGPGRTVFIGFDSTYRWRYLHEQHFDGFWARLIDRVGRSKVLGGRYPFTLSTDKSVYRAGDRVTVRATMVGSGEESSSFSELRGEVELAGQSPAPIQLDPLSDQPGVLESTFTAEEAGAYLLRIVPATAGTEADATAVRPATLSFKVEPPRQELDNPKLDRTTLEDIAKASAGGEVFTLVDQRLIPDAFRVKQVERVLEHRDEMWDAPLLFGLFLVLITVEWVLRKKFRMA